MPAFALQTPVMFQHCDPAGIVFYPRYFEMINAVVENFFSEAMAWPFSQMHGSDRVGVPMGRLSTEFHAASRLGDMLDWTLDITRIGGASLDLRLAASGAGEPRLTALGTLVLVDLDTLRSRRWPDDKRLKLQAFMEDAA